MKKRMIRKELRKCRKKEEKEGLRRKKEMERGGKWTEKRRDRMRRA